MSKKDLMLSKKQFWMNNLLHKSIYVEQKKPSPPRTFQDIKKTSSSQSMLQVSKSTQTDSFGVSTSVQTDACNYVFNMPSKIVPDSKITHFQHSFELGFSEGPSQSPMIKDVQHISPIDKTRDTEKKVLISPTGRLDFEDPLFSHSKDGNQCIQTQESTKLCSSTKTDDRELVSENKIALPSTQSVLPQKDEKPRQPHNDLPDEHASYEQLCEFASITKQKFCFRCKCNKIYDPWQLVDNMPFHTLPDNWKCQKCKKTIKKQFLWSVYNNDIREVELRLRSSRGRYW
jgi:hypothetical protein